MKLTLLFSATILLMRFRTFGKLRPSLVSNGKFIILPLSSSGVCSVLSDCFQDSESEELRSSLLEDTVESLALSKKNVDHHDQKLFTRYKTDCYLVIIVTLAYQALRKHHNKIAIFYYNPSNVTSML